MIKQDIESNIAHNTLLMIVLIEEDGRIVEVVRLIAEGIGANLSIGFNIGLLVIGEELFDEVKGLILAIGDEIIVEFVAIVVSFKVCVKGEISLNNFLVDVDETVVM